MESYLFILGWSVEGDRELVRRQSADPVRSGGPRTWDQCFRVIQIFSAKLLICPQTFINLKHTFVQKLEMYEFDIHFSHESAGVQFDMFY